VTASSIFGKFSVAKKKKKNPRKLEAKPIHREKKYGGCTFYHNTLRTKLSQLSQHSFIALVEFE